MFGFMNRFNKTLRYMCMLGKDLNCFRVSTYEQISVLHYFLYTLYFVLIIMDLGSNKLYAYNIYIYIKRTAFSTEQRKVTTAENCTGGFPFLVLVFCILHISSRFILRHLCIGKELSARFVAENAR